MTLDFSIQKRKKKVLRLRLQSATLTAFLGFKFSVTIFIINNNVHIKRQMQILIIWNIFSTTLSSF